MNKEVLIAIVIGVLLGLAGALYLNTRHSFTLPSKPALTGKKVQIVTKPKNELNVRFDTLPRINEILTKTPFEIKGFNRGFDLLVAANTSGIKTLRLKKSGPFKLTVELSPGFNRIILNAHAGKTVQVKVINVFYFKKRAVVPTPTLAEEAEATNEAAILKKKLEQKVFELRSTAKKAVYGLVKTIDGKELAIVSEGKTYKVALEPEVTDFFQVDGVGVQEASFEDIAKNDTVTAFVSQIGDEEKSYTVYRESSRALFAGKVSNINTATYQVSLVNFDKTTHDIDVENGSVQKVYNMTTDTTERFGFSKLEVGDYIYAIADMADKNYFFEEYIMIRTK